MPTLCISRKEGRKEQSNVKNVIEYPLRFAGAEMLGYEALHVEIVHQMRVLSGTTSPTLAKRVPLLLARNYFLKKVTK